ncbi:MAG: MMPL family transporter [Solirubrobacteraceae bacterium]
MQQHATTAQHDDAATPITHSWLGRSGAWAADHHRAVAIAWCGVVLVLGALAPFADRTLSGAGWEALDSESVAARRALEAHFPGRGTYALSVVVAGRRAGTQDPAMRATLARVRAVLRSDTAVSGVLAPRAGYAISQHRSTAVVVGLAGATPAEMVKAAGRLKNRLARLSAPGVAVRLTGAAAMWSDFNAANKAAMLKSEMLSWPLTLVLLLFAFGTLVAAGLPLLLTMSGLLGAGGLLFLCGQFADVSIWAMNFAMMFAIALGIDYALFIVVRFRSALAAGLAPREATALTMATAGRAVLVSGLTVIAALLAVTLVPVPAFRSVPLGIALAVLMVLAATLTLLPAVLSRLGHRINGGRVRVGGGIDHRSERFAAWGRRLWARPLPYGAAAGAILLLLAAPALGLRTGMPTAEALPRDADSREGQRLLQRAFGDGAVSSLQIVVADRGVADARSALARDPGIASVAPAESSRGHVLLTATPKAPTSRAELRTTIDRLRGELPAGALVGGPAAETRDLESVLVSRLPVVVGVVLGLGFVLLLALLRAPLAAAAAVVLSLLATAAAFGVARLVFQEGAFEELLGFESQGFVDAWAPIFFFALVFALAMDYTVFLLATVKAVYDRDGDARHAVVEGLAGTGRVINAAAAVMVVVFMTFALAGPIALKEMGVILAVAVLLDATLIRLLLQPVVLRLLGARAWWMPAWLDRLVPNVGLSQARLEPEPAPG